MSALWVLKFFYILIYIELTLAKCTKSAYETDTGYWLKCTNATIADTLREQIAIYAITISNSNIESIPTNSFGQYKKTLTGLNIYGCRLRDLSSNAFTNLWKLKKLNLAHNELTALKSTSFSKLPVLEQLDLSYNKIQIIQNGFFENLPTLKLLSLDENQLNCLGPSELQNLPNLAQIRILENPLSLICRGQLTLWLKDHRINYSNERPNGMESWMDSLLWRCAIEDDVIAKSEEKIKQCVILGMFNQFKETIVSLDDYEDTKDICKDYRREFVDSLSRKGPEWSMTNAGAVDKLIRVIGQVLSN